MNRFLPSPVKSRVLSSRLGSILLLFQRSPIVQMLFPEARIISGAGLGEITTWTIATIAGLGAYDSVAGATTLTQLMPSPNSTTVPTAVGANLSFIFQVTGAPSTPKSWQIIGSLPGGLTHTNSTGNSIDSITGTPTQAGNYNITVKAWEEKNNRGGSVSKSFTINVGSAIITSQPASTTISSGNNATLSVGTSGSGITYQWYQGNSPNTSTPLNNKTSANFTTPSLSSTTKYWVRVTKGSIVSDSDTATVTVNSVIAPVITNQPDSLTINSGNTTTLTVAASGTSPDYQWYRGNSGVTSNPIANSNSATYTTPALTSNTSYWVRVSNPGGSDDSNTATVTVRIPPSITTQPVPVTINSGQTATFNVAASGSSPGFQWYIGNSGDISNPIQGEVTSSLTTAALAETTNFWVRASNAAGSADSETVTATVLSPPQITHQPDSTIIGNGETTTLTVNATGGSPTYQWYQGEAGDDSSPVALATSASFTTPALTSTTSYWVRVTGNGQSTDSLTATVTVGGPIITKPEVVASPVSLSVSMGGTTLLTSTFSGDSPSFQWYIGNTGDFSSPIADAVSSSYQTPALDLTTTYWVRASNAAGSANSDSATVTVIIPPTITTRPSTRIIKTGASTTLSITMTGSDSEYQWYLGSTGDTSNPVVAALHPTFKTPALSKSTSYWVRATNPAGTSDSQTFVIQVVAPPAIVSQPTSASAVKGKKAKLKIKAKGGTLKYQWYKGASGNTKKPVKGANSSSFVTPPLKTKASFWVKVSNPVGVVNSKTINVSIKKKKKKKKN